MKTKATKVLKYIFLKGKRKKEGREMVWQVFVFVLFCIGTVNIRELIR